MSQQAPCDIEKLRRARCATLAPEESESQRGSGSETGMKERAISMGPPSSRREGRGSSTYAAIPNNDERLRREGTVFFSGSGQRLGAGTPPSHRDAESIPADPLRQDTSGYSGPSFPLSLPAALLTPVNAAPLALPRDPATGSTPPTEARRVWELSEDSLELLDATPTPPDADDKAGQGTQAGRAVKGKTAKEGAVRAVSGRLQSRSDYVSRLSVTPPPASQNIDRHSHPSPPPVQQQPLFDPIPEEEETRLAEENEDLVRLHPDERRSLSEAIELSRKEAEERTPSQSVVAATREKAADVAMDEAEGDDDEDAGIDVWPDFRPTKPVVSKGKRREATPFIDLTQEAQDDAGAMAANMEQEMMMPRNALDVRDLTERVEEDLDLRDASPIPEGVIPPGMTEAQFRREQRMIESSMTPQLLNTQDRHAADERDRQTWAGARRGLRPGDGAPLLDRPGPSSRRPANGRIGAKARGQAQQRRVRQLSPDDLPELDRETRRACSAALSISSRGSASSPGKAGMPPPSRIPARDARPLLVKIERERRPGQQYRDGSQSSETTSSSSSSGSKRKRDGDMDGGRTLNFRGKESREHWRERRRHEEEVSARESEKDLAVKDEPEMELAYLRNVCRIADAEEVKVMVGGCLIYELVFQRFIILAIFRYHDTDEAIIDDILQRPYFAVPWRRMLDALRDAADHAWGLHVSRDRQGNVPVRARSWSDRLRILPFLKQDPLASARCRKCQLCQRDFSDRHYFDTLQLSGQVYDDDTFVGDFDCVDRGAERYPERADDKEEAGLGVDEDTFNVGSACRTAATIGHRLYHTLYQMFSEFETDYFLERVEEDQEFKAMVVAKDVNGVTAYFRDDYQAGNMRRGERQESLESVKDKIIRKIKVAYDDYMIDNRLDPIDLAMMLRRLL